MAIIRHGVERVFEEFDRYTAPEDYKPQLAQIVKQLGVVAHRMDSLEQTPVLRHGPDHYARQMVQAGVLWCGSPSRRSKVLPIFARPPARFSAT